MSFELSLQLSLDQSLRETACRLLEEAAAGLNEGTDRDDAIHQARKHLKKLRALLRLIEPPLGRRHRPCDRYFRDIARRLAPLRDACVRQQTLAQLAQQQPALAEVIRELLVLLPASNGVKKPGKVARQAATALREGRQWIARWPPLEPRYRTLGGGFKAVYLEARDPVWQLAGVAEAEPWHQWRKWVKYHGYQLRFLQPLAPDWLQPRAQQSKELGEWLGREHDLDMLAGLLGRYGARLEGLAEPILPLIVQQRQALRAQALDLGRQLFEAEADDIGRRLKRHWLERRG